MPARRHLMKKLKVKKPKPNPILVMCRYCNKHGYFIVGTTRSQELACKSAGELFVRTYAEKEEFTDEQAKDMLQQLAESPLPDLHLVVPVPLLWAVNVWNNIMDQTDQEPDYTFHEFRRQIHRDRIPPGFIESMDLEFEHGVHPENTRVN